MPLLRASAAGLRTLASDGKLAQQLATQFAMSIGHRASEAEVRSWERSLPALAQDVVDAGLDNVEVLVEYRLPQSSKRIDAVLAGVHPSTNRPSFVVVELKQWSRAIPVDGTDDLVLIDAYGPQPVLHPVEQVRRYAMFLIDFMRALEHEPDPVSGAAYLHNARERDVEGLRLLPETHLGRLFTGSVREKWLEYLRSRLAPKPGGVSADLLVQSRVAPSRQLMAVAAVEIRDREMFTLLDEQQVAYSLVLRAVERARASDRKTVVLVTGGPGSGKSVIALSLLGELNRRGYAAMHATGSKAFTETLRRVAGWRNNRVKGLFKFFNSFMNADKNALDVLIADEAHRLRETSASRWTTAAERTGAPQVQELFNASRVPVFLLDEHQVVRPGELGNAAVVREAAQQFGLDLEQVDLDGQFRSGGSRAYEQWVLRLLGLADGGPERWIGDEHFSLHVAETPQELEGDLAARQKEGYTARMTAGFCWRWSKPDKSDGLVDDIRIGDWVRPWNNPQERAFGDIPARSLWATEPGGFGQVGCIYTAQGFEYDWNGVIFGPDFVWRNNAFVSDASATKDPAFRGKNAGDFDQFVRNVYKVLLTRSMVGTVLYSTDLETRGLFRSLTGSAE
jgi:uncharacterized protein